MTNFGSGVQATDPTRNARAMFFPGTRFKTSYCLLECHLVWVGNTG